MNSEYEALPGVSPLPKIIVKNRKPPDRLPVDDLELEIPILTMKESTDTLCGLTRFFRPPWLQKFATTRYYMIAYGLLGTVQAMGYIYFTVTLTHIEKRFKLSSKTTGIMLSGNETSQILLSLFLTYTGGQKNRPLWVALGTACTAVSCFIMVIPHILYGAGQDALALTQEYMDESVLKNHTDMENFRLCSNSSNPNPSCIVRTTDDFSAVPTVTIFISEFVSGIGSTLYFSLGQTYIDDNTKKTNTPLLLGITLALRTIGPAFGFLIGFVCLRLYVDPRLTPKISDKDPRWIGAWWLGWIFLGCAQFLLAFILAMFPKKMPQKRKGQLESNLTVAVNVIGGATEKSKNIDEEKMDPQNNNKQGDSTSLDPELSFKDFCMALKRILSNKLLMVNCWAGVFYILGASGFMTYSIKYLEVQFQKSAADSSRVTGPLAISAMCLGLLSSGILISKFRPGPRPLLFWNVIVGTCVILGQLVFLYLSCKEKPLVGYSGDLNRVDLMNYCNKDCGCSNVKYNPVCHRTLNRTFASACHAGCHTSLKLTDNLEFGDCSCSNIPIRGERFGDESSFDSWADGGQSADSLTQFRYNTEALSDNFTKENLKAGPCAAECGYNFIAFLIITCLTQFLGSSGKIGNILVNYRAVSEADKSFSQGLSLLMISLFAFIPGPIVYGYIIDTTCIIWDESCGARGNCWLYNKDDFRKKLCLTGAAFTTIGVILDAWVCYLGKDLDLYGEKDEEKKENENEKEKEKQETLNGSL